MKHSELRHQPRHVNPRIQVERSIKTYLRGDSGFSSQNFMKPVRVRAVSY